MTAIQAHDKIQTLRVKARDGDTPALRLALMQTLASVNLHPAGMPPSAIFIIHYLDDPLPGCLTSKKQNTSSWRNALRENIDVLYRQAATPTSCTLSGNPAAVLFRDQAELLACLVVDICAQRVGQHWWWRNRYFSSIHSSHRIRETLIQDARYIPAVFSHLASAGKALEVVKHLEPSHAGDILQVLLSEFSLSAMRELMTEAERDNADVQPASILKKNNQSPHPGPTIKSSHSIPPWAALFSEDTWQADLQHERAALLGIARTLHERPAVMRNRIFQRSFAQWWANEHHTASNSGNISAMHSMESQSPDFLKKDRLAKIIPFAADNSPKVLQEEIAKRHLIQKESAVDLNPSFIGEGNTNKNTHGMPGLTWEDFSPPANKQNRDKLFLPKNETRKIEICNGYDSNADIAEPSSREIEIRIAQNDNAELVELRDGTALKNPLVSPKAIATDNNILPEEYLENNNEVNLHFSDTFIDTRLGGIIFLINLIHQLGLPGCFDKRWQLEQQLSPWALVDLFARALLGKQFASFYADPLWRVLAKLDGRRTKLQIAKNFCGQTDYRIPHSWFAWLQDDQIYWAKSRNNIRIWTSTCVLVDAAYNGDALAGCIKEMHAYIPEFNPASLHQATYRRAPLERRAHIQANGINAELARLLALMMPFVFTFLRQQLSTPVASKKELVRALLHLDARIYLSSSHIDLVTEIDNTRFALRCAGLDQDPGWLPDYGRVVLIHFS